MNAIQVRHWPDIDEPVSRPISRSLVHSSRVYTDEKPTARYQSRSVQIDANTRNNRKSTTTPATVGSIKRDRPPERIRRLKPGVRKDTVVRLRSSWRSLGNLPSMRQVPAAGPANCEKMS